MVNTMMTFIFQIYYGLPIIRLLIGILSYAKVIYNNLTDLKEILYGDKLEDGEYNGDKYFYVTPLTRPLIWIIIDLNLLGTHVF